MEQLWRLQIPRISHENSQRKILAVFSNALAWHSHSRHRLSSISFRILFTIFHFKELVALKYQLSDYWSWLSHGAQPQPSEIDASANVSIMGHQVSRYSLYKEKVKYQKYSKTSMKSENMRHWITYYTHHGFLGHLSHAQHRRPYMVPWSPAQASILVPLFLQYL